ncbi:CTD nuclear envelope phosphatase 1A-like isoform X2 [Narcine bancroftii]|uniref:CTD nuclear envelope phosphatase 1A-like isoform X2 n=1 Tax=Narcine bancroftii TaxID=1343680 RepID=UPI0038318AA8
MVRTLPKSAADCQVLVDRQPIRFFVHKRPHVDFFLEVASQWYELVIFTASMEIYGAAVADKLDNNKKILNRRYYRQHCTLELGSYVKDLAAIHNDLSSIVILDNSPSAYRGHPANHQWADIASNRASWRLTVRRAATSFEEDHRAHLTDKRQRRKNPTPTNQFSLATVPACPASDLSVTNEPAADVDIPLHKSSSAKPSQRKGRNLVLAIVSLT